MCVVLVYLFPENEETTTNDLSDEELEDEGL